MTTQPAQSQQEAFYEAVWTSEDMSDADKAPWRYECRKDYWARLEAIREASTPLRYLWMTALAYLEEETILWRGGGMFGEVALTVDDIRRVLRASNPHGDGPLSDEQIADGLAKAITRVRRPADAPHPDDADETEEAEPDHCDFENCPGEVVAWTDRDKWCYAHALGLFGEESRS